MSIDALQAAKSTVRRFHEAFDASPDQDLVDVLSAHVSADYAWPGMHPFHEQSGVQAVVDTFWLPLRQSLTSLQRREDVFMAGRNDVYGGKSIWVAGMGHMMGLFDQDWLGIPATGKMAFLVTINCVGGADPRRPVPDHIVVPGFSEQFGRAVVVVTDV